MCIDQGRSLEPGGWQVIYDAHGIARDPRSIEGMAKACVDVGAYVERVQSLNSCMQRYIPITCKWIHSHVRGRCSDVLCLSTISIRAIIRALSL